MAFVLRIVLRCGLQMLVNVWSEMNNPDEEDVDLDKFATEAPQPLPTASAMHGGGGTPLAAQGALGTASGHVGGAGAAVGSGSSGSVAAGVPVPPHAVVYNAVGSATGGASAAQAVPVVMVRAVPLARRHHSGFLDPGSLYSPSPVFPQ